MIDEDVGGDCTDQISLGAGDAGGETAGLGRPTQLNPIDELPKIRGAPLIDQAHQTVIPSAKGKEARKL